MLVGAITPDLKVCEPIRCSNYYRRLEVVGSIHALMEPHVMQVVVLKEVRKEGHIPHVRLCWQLNRHQDVICDTDPDLPFLAVLTFPCLFTKNCKDFFFKLCKSMCFTHMTIILARNSSPKCKESLQSFQFGKDPCQKMARKHNHPKKPKKQGKKGQGIPCKWSQVSLVS